MAYKLTPPLIQEFYLLKADKEFSITEDPTRITIRQATQGDEEMRNELLNSVLWIYDEDILEKHSFELSNDEITRKEVFITLASCNILDSTNLSLFRFEDNRIAMPEVLFNLAWGQLPYIYAEEIIECVHIINHHWVLQGIANNG